MPNWVTNVLTVTQDGEPINLCNPALWDEIRNYVRGTEIGDDGQEIAFDFANIVPEPEGLFDQGDVKTEIQTLHSAPIPVTLPTWYNWRVENWGTKWNVAWAGAGDFTFAFDTAWSTPEPIIAELSRKFPTVEFTVEFADEDIGSGNCGTYQYVAGECTGMTEGDEEFAREFLGWEDMDEDEFEEEVEKVQQALANLEDKQ